MRYILCALVIGPAALAAAVGNTALQIRANSDDVCFKCAKSYVDCYQLFGLSGCTDKNAEHFTWSRQCTGFDPAW